MLYGEDAEVKVLESQNKVLSAMYDDEKTTPDKLDKEKLKEISHVRRMVNLKVTQTPIEEVEDVIDKYEVR